MALFSRHCAHVLRTEKMVIGGYDVTGGFNPSALADREIVRKVYCAAPTFWHALGQRYVCARGHRLDTWRLSGAQKAILVIFALVAAVILKTWAS